MFRVMKDAETGPRQTGPPPSDPDWPVDHRASCLQPANLTMCSTSNILYIHAPTNRFYMLQYLIHIYMLQYLTHIHAPTNRYTYTYLPVDQRASCPRALPDNILHMQYFIHIYMLLQVLILEQIVILLFQSSLCPCSANGPKPENVLHMQNMHLSSPRALLLAHSGTGRDFLVRNGLNRTKTAVTQKRSD